MKTKLFLAAVAVTFSFAMMSCAGNKTTNAASEGEETTVETVEAVVESDSCCQAVGISVLKEVSVSAFHDQVAFRAVAYGTKNRHPVRHGVIDRKSSVLIMKYRPLFVIYFWEKSALTYEMIFFSIKK